MAHSTTSSCHRTHTDHLAAADRPHAEQHDLSAHRVARVPRGVVLPGPRRAGVKLLAPNRTRRLLLHSRLRRPRLRRPRLRRRAPLQVPVGRQVLSVGHHWLGSRRPVPQRGGDQQRDEADDWQKPRQRQPPCRIALRHAASTTRPANWEVTSYANWLVIQHAPLFGGSEVG